MKKEKFNMDRETLSARAKWRFVGTHGAFDESEQTARQYNRLTYDFIILFKGEYLKKYGICEHDLEIDKSDPNDHKLTWGNDKRGKIFNLILDDAKGYNHLSSIAQIIGHFLSDPIRSREVSQFKKQISYLLENGDPHIKALLVGTVALGLLRASERAEINSTLDDPKAVWEELNKPAVINADLINLDDVRRQKGGAQ